MFERENSLPYTRNILHNYKAKAHHQALDQQRLTVHKYGKTQTFIQDFILQSRDIARRCIIQTSLSIQPLPPH